MRVFRTTYQLLVSPPAIRTLPHPLADLAPHVAHAPLERRVGLAKVDHELAQLLQPLVNLTELPMLLFLGGAGCRGLVSRLDRGL